MDQETEPIPNRTDSGRQFRGEGWNPVVRYEWFVTLHVTWWERDQDPDWVAFASDWAREIFLNR